MNRDIILASKSETRIKLLRNAGITFEPVAHGIDEDGNKDVDEQKHTRRGCG